MHLLLTIPAFVKILIGFGAILVLYRCKISLGLSIVISSIALCAWTGTGMAGFMHVLHQYALADNYLLLIVVSLLLLFTEALEKTGKMQITVNALKTHIKNPLILLAGLPALVGLLPMPGGALFSAPMVQSADGKNELSGSVKSGINYWYRHIWEYWWPLYPGVILATSYSHLSMPVFIALQFPFTVVSIVSGYFFILRKARGMTPSPGVNTPMHKALATIAPLVLVVICAVAGIAPIMHFGFSANQANLIAMLIGIVGAQIWVFAANPTAVGPALKMFTKPKTWDMILIFVAIMAFSAVLTMPVNVKGETLVMLMRDEFVRYHVPLLLIGIAIPFISGMVTGIAMGFVGAAFPLVFAMLGPSPTLAQAASTCVLAYGFGYIGILLSPVHICFVVSNQFFKVKLFQAYKLIFWPSVCIAVAAVVLSITYGFALK